METREKFSERMKTKSPRSALAKVGAHTVRNVPLTKEGTREKLKLFPSKQKTGDFLKLSNEKLF